jgi:hypothetical protein
MVASLAVAEIDHAGWGVKEPGIGVPLGRVGGEAPVGLGEPFNRRHRFRATENGRRGASPAFACSFATDLPDEIEGEKGVI